VEAPGTAPGSGPLITQSFIAIVGPKPDPVNIGVGGKQLKAARPARLSGQIGRPRRVVLELASRSFRLAQAICLPPFAKELPMSNWPGDAAVFPLCTPLIKQFEGFRAAPYLDSAGIPTIGYGTIQYPDGSAVTIHDPAITEPEAESFLKFQMSQKSAAIAPCFQKKPTLHQAAAMLSLTYNIGSGAFKSSTVLRKFNAADLPAAADAFLLWDKAVVDGQLVVVPGLHKRRVAERTIFLTVGG